ASSPLSGTRRKRAPIFGLSIVCLFSTDNYTYYGTALSVGHQLHVLRATKMGPARRRTSPLSFPDLWGSRLWSRGRLRLTCPKTMGQQPNPRSRPGSQRSELREYGLSLVNRGAIATGYPAKQKLATGTLARLVGL